MTSSITIGTRGSQLALWQSQYIKNQINNHYPHLDVRLKIIKTKGDTIQDRSLVGLGKGVFTKEIEIALLGKEIDIAVHSLKDLPTEIPEGLCITAIPSREDPRDILITEKHITFNDLPNGAKIGTSSPRRKAQLLHLRSDLKIVDIRGNVDTRIDKLYNTDIDGIILAAAGIKRLQKEDIITQYFEINQIVPAVGQGALAIQVCEDNTGIIELLQPINDTKTSTEISAERTVLEVIGGGCQLPIGAYADSSDDELLLIASVCHPNGSQRIFEEYSGELMNAIDIGRIVAEKLLNNGAEKLLDFQVNKQ
ncbi:hydroxymethylbilane synthase [Candidatus Poribacteria bacterium]|nr:MAG: hydroxymethylbilane synthase [Candidatus Poribacteria bacterium]